MIDHIGIEVSDYQKAKQFYEKILAPLGYKRKRSANSIF